MQGSGGLQGVDAQDLRGQDRALVQPLGHAHDLDAGDLVPRHDRPLDGRRAAPAGQERGVEVEAAQPRRVENGGGQDLAEGHHHGGVEAEGREGRDLVGVTHGERGADRHAMGQGEGVGRRGLQLMAAAPGGGRLRIDGRDLVARVQQGGETGHGEVGGSQESQAHGGGLPTG